MELKQIKLASEAPTCLQRAVKVALAVGANVFLTTDQSSLMAQFEGADKYYFDPENVTLHMFEALGQARTFGFAARVRGARRHYPVLLNYDLSGVMCRVAGMEPCFSTNPNTCTATRQALVTAFCVYYDHVANTEA